jgi:hypothetical protein
LILPCLNYFSDIIFIIRNLRNEVKSIYHNRSDNCIGQLKLCITNHVLVSCLYKRHLLNEIVNYLLFAV